MDNSTLHCKVSFRNDLRRFPMNNIEFSELQKTIQNIFGLEKELILQYRDNENDFITLSSNEELECALSCISGNVLQIFVNDPSSPSMDPKSPMTPPFHPYWGQHPHPYGGHHPHPHPHPHWGHHGGHHRPCHFGKDHSHFSYRISQKKDLLSRKLKEIETGMMELSVQEEQLSPLQQRRLEVLQKKKKSVEHHLTKVDDWANRMSGKKSEKCYKKHAKHEKKFMKKIDKHRKYFINSSFLPETTKTELLTLQAKIHSLKPELEEIQIQLKASKAALKEAQERGESTDQWLQEIAQLTEAKHAKKQQMVPLCLQMRDIHAQMAH